EAGSVEPSGTPCRADRFPVRPGPRSGREPCRHKRHTSFPEGGRGWLRSPLRRRRDCPGAAGVCGGDPGRRRNLDSRGAGGGGGYQDRAPGPGGAEPVQMVEHSQRSGDGREVVILKPVKPGENIAPRGAEASTGDLVLEHGRVLGPAEIAVLATFGYTRVKVYTRPRVALIATGDELIDADQPPRTDKIPN